MYEKAGAFFEKLDDSHRAMEAYRRGQAYARAVDLSRRAFQGRDVVELEEQWGDYLVSRKNPDAAVNHYTEAGAYIKAIEAAIACRQWAKASQIVETLAPSDAKQYYAQIAKHYEQARTYDDAERFFLKAGQPQDAVEMYSRINKWEKAHRVATEHMTQAEVAMLYITQAHRLESSGKFKEAERLYVMVHEPDLAINMYKKSRRYEDMIRLVTSYRKDLLTETHLHLAQQLETEGAFKQAEKHYVEANDWGSAVNMYRANDLWDDAIRVAKLHGGVNASKKVAYAWATSLGGEAGAKLLTKFGLIDEAIEYAMEIGAFEHAFSLALASRKEKLPEVHLKYAMYLEDEGRFEQAEKEFIKADKPKEAIDMYTHQQDWANALRVAESSEPAAVPDVLVAQAKVFLERSEFTKAEALYIRAKKPELAVKMYKDALRWNDAIRIAREFLPHRIADLMAEHQAYINGERGAESDETLMGPGRALEDAREFSRAIDAYLQVTAERTKNHDFLEELWENAVKLAMNHVPERIPEVVSTVSKRLIEIKRYAQAAEIYEGIDRHKEAIDVYIAGGMWEQARSLATSSAPQYARQVEEAYKRHLTDSGEAVALVREGNVVEGIEAYAQQGEWDKCLELAQQQGPTMLLKYATLHGANKIAQSDFQGAATIFAKYGTNVVAGSLAMYRRVTKECLASACAQGDADGELLRSGVRASGAPLLDLRVMLHKVVQALSQAGDEQLPDFDRLLWISHLSAATTVASERGASECRKKIAISLLRYLRDIPADKAFYEAGMGCKTLNELTHAFVFLNRFLDITEAVEDHEPSSTTLDNSDFADTQIPFDFPLPEKNYLDEAEREKVRDYVLELSMNSSVQQQLNKEEIDLVMREVDQVREVVQRGGRAHAGSDELFQIVRDTVAQVG